MRLIGICLPGQGTVYTPVHGPVARCVFPENFYVASCDDLGFATLSWCGCQDKFPSLNGVIPEYEDFVRCDADAGIELIIVFRELLDRCLTSFLLRRRINVEMRVRVHECRLLGVVCIPGLDESIQHGPDFLFVTHLIWFLSRPTVFVQGLIRHIGTRCERHHRERAGPKSNQHETGDECLETGGSQTF